MDCIMKHLIAWPVLIALASPAAQADILDFGSASNVPLSCSSAPNGSGTPVACNNGAVIAQAYGDTGVVDITYTDLSPQRLNQSLLWWSSGFNNLYGVVYAGTNADLIGSRARIEIKPKVSGMTVNLSSFDFGSWSNPSRSTNINIYAINGTAPLFTRSPITVGTITGATSFTPNISSTSGLWIEWQNLAYNVGIDNIRFSVTATVDEPDSAALFLGGLVVLTWWAARRESVGRPKPDARVGEPRRPGA
jgi:hypothetical protein